MPRAGRTALLLLAACLLPPSAARAAVRATVVTATGAQAVLEQRLQVRLSSATPTRVRVLARLDDGVPVALARSVQLRAGGKRTVALPLTVRGIAALRRCPAARLTLVLQRGRVQRRTIGRRTSALRPGCTSAAPPAAPAPAGPRRVVFSTDFTPGLVGPLPASPYPSDVDDGIAVAMALNARALRIDGLAIQFGNNDAEPSTAQARVMVHEVMGRREVPIAQGAKAKLPPAPAAGAADPCVNDGVRLLSRLLRQGPATVIASGPLTDMACLARTDPEASANVDEVLAQIGARPGEAYDLNGRPALFSLNVGVDPEATRTVLSSPALAHATITASPYHFAGGLLLDDARVDRLGGSSAEGMWLREKAVGFRAFWRASFGDDGLRPWDQTLVYRLIRPETTRTVDVGWRMVDCSDPSGRNMGAACAGHGPSQFPTRDGEGQQLWLGDGPGQQARPRLRILSDYATPADGPRFLDAVTALRG